MLCPKCDDRGAVRVQYRSGEPFDVGICSCEMANLYRLWLRSEPGHRLLGDWFGLPIERIWLVEELAEGVEPSSKTTSRDILVSAGKVDRAGLGGKVKRK